MPGEREKTRIREVCPGKPVAAPAYKKAATMITAIHSVSKTLTIIPSKPFSKIARMPLVLCTGMVNEDSPPP